MNTLPHQCPIVHAHNSDPLKMFMLYLADSSMVQAWREAVWVPVQYQNIFLQVNEVIYCLNAFLHKQDLFPQYENVL